jgi:hypothetical protein
VATLHIEHAITEYAVWKGAFDRFAGMREQAGVTGHRISQPVDDPLFVVIDLDFDTADAAGSFLGILRTRVWATPENSPALVGAPQAKVLQTVDRM